MRAVDTNVLVRFIVADDPDQALRARAIVPAERLFIPVTVLLEAEWVLRSAYGFAPARVSDALRRLVGLPTIAVQHPAEVSRALAGAAQGVDFADALHLALSAGCSDFISFDRSLARDAAQLGALAVAEP